MTVSDDATEPWASDPHWPEAPVAEPAADRVTWLLPALVALSGAGVVGIAALDIAARHGWRERELFWLGLLAIVVPPLVRLLGSAAGRTERIVLSVTVGVGAYAVKALHDPWLTYSDEWAHRFNVIRALDTGTLFHANPIIGVTANYPGLAGITAVVASATGLSVTAAGLVVIGVARLLFMLALFALIERVGGSARIAGIACAVYVAAPNFAFWSGQFAYESLALPVLVALLALAALILRDPAPGEDPALARRQRRSLAVVGAVAVLLIVVSHHVTSYAAIVLLGVLAAAYHHQGRRHGVREVAALAGLAAVATLVWLATVARDTFDYLGYITGAAFDSIVSALGGAGQRRLFQGGAGVVTPPIAERGLALLGVVLLLAAAVVGLRIAWRRRREPFVALLAVGGLAYFASLPLRFAPDAWEAGNRASSLLFVGLVLLVGLAVAGLGEERSARRRGLRTAGLAVGAAIVVMTGVIAGWPTDLRLPWPYREDAGNGVAASQPVAVARWLRTAAAPGARALADEASGRTLPVVGGVDVLAGRAQGVHDLLDTAPLPPWQRELLRAEGITLAVVDDRQLGWDNMRGYYFPTAGEDGRRRDPAIVGKFATAGADRIADSGHIVVYDLRRILGAPTG